MGIVQNMDVAMLSRKLVRMYEEAVKSASSSHNGIKGADKARFLAYLADFRAALLFFVDQPEMDMPEWTPTDIQIPDLAATIQPENEAIFHFATIIQALYTEVTLCQSARDGAGILSPDASRFEALLEKCEKFLEGYMTDSLPIDYPESSPARETTGPGKKTVLK